MNIQFTDNTKEVIEAKNEAVKRALYAVGIHLEGEAKEELENTPRRIDTGLLRNSITFALSGEAPQIKTYSGDKPSSYGNSTEVPSGSYSGTAPNDPKDEQAVYIGTNVEYAIYVHEGVQQRMEPNRFLRNAVEKNQSQIKDYIERELKKAQI